jgi:hypothetical protein
MFKINLKSKLFLICIWVFLCSQSFAVYDQSEPLPQKDWLYLYSSIETASKYCLDNDFQFNWFSTLIEWTQNLNFFNSISQEWEIISWTDYIWEITCFDYKKIWLDTSMIHTFSELDYSELTFEDNFVDSWTWQIISYTKQNEALIKINYQILYILIFIWFVISINTFYPIINDVLWKR